MTDWIKRAYIPVEDEDALVYMWLESYAESKYGKARHANTSKLARSRFWGEEKPVVELLLATANVEVVCDPDRVRAEGDKPAVIWAFAVTSGDLVHWLGVKRKVVHAGFGPDITRDLLGSRFQRPCGYTHELVELVTGSCGLRLPGYWYSDSTAIARMMLGRAA